MRETEMRLTEISTALDSVRARLAAACLAAGREVSDVALLPVTKFFPASDARILYELGCREFGESREQEAVEKVADFDGAAQTGAIDDPVRWHMIGQLQRNKARSVAKWAYAIHSVDSARLADALDRAALSALSGGERTEPLRALIQVSLDGDPARGGVPTGELTPLAERIESAEGLEFAGLMAVPPLGSDPDEQFEILAVIERVAQALVAGGQRLVMSKANITAVANRMCSLWTPAGIPGTGSITTGQAAAGAV